jgi:hypothetical protein
MTLGMSRRNTTEQAFKLTNEGQSRSCWLDPLVIAPADLYHSLLGEWLEGSATRSEKGVANFTGGEESLGQDPRGDLGAGQRG